MNAGMPDLASTLQSPASSFAARRGHPQLSDAQLRDILEAAIAAAFKVSSPHLRTATRGFAHVAFARQAAMYLAHIALGLSLTDVGRIFSRDRTTVAHACVVVEDLRDDWQLDRVLDLLGWCIRQSIGRD